MPDAAARRRRDRILYTVLIVCSTLAALTGVGSSRYFTSELRKHDHANCIANRSFLKLLEQSLVRQKRSLKVDPPAKKKIDQTAINQIQVLIDGYAPAVAFCPEKT